MESGIFDPYYVAEVLSDLLSRQRGREVKITLIPKDPSEAPQIGGASEQLPKALPNSGG